MPRPFLIILSVLGLVTATVAVDVAGLVVGNPAERAQWHACRIVDAQGWPRSDANIKAAVDACTTIIETGRQTRQGFVEALLNRGRAYGRVREFDRAIADFEEAVRLDPQNAILLMGRGDAYRARSRPRRVMTVEEARQAEEASRPWLDRAIADYSQAIRLKPSVNLFLRRGNAYVSIGEYDRVLPDFDEAIRLDPNNAEALMYRAGLYQFRGDYPRSIADYDQAIRLDPGRIASFLGRGMDYEAIGQYERAIEDYSQAIRLTPDYIYDSDLPALRCRARLALGQLADALADCDAALKDLSQTNLYALTGRALVHLRMGNLDLALADFDRLIKWQSDDAEALYGRGLAKRMKGDASGAEGDLAAATKIDPDIAAKTAKYGLPAQ